MALSDTQFEELKKQLEKRKSSLGETEYQSFLERAATSMEEDREADPNAPSNAIGDFQAGAAKSFFGRTVMGLGSLGRKVQRLLPSPLQGLPGDGKPASDKSGVFDEGSPINLKAESIIAPKNTAEKVGSFAGEAASFAVGGGFAKAPAGANFLRRAAALGTADGTVAAVRAGDVDKEARDAAILAAVFPVAGSAINAVRGAFPTTSDAAGRVINSLIKPLLKDFAYGKNPGKAVAEEGIVASSFDELAAKIKQRRQEVGRQIGEVMAIVKERFDLSDVLQPLEDAVTEAAKNPRTNSTIIRRLQNLQDDLRRVTEDAAGNVSVGRSFDDLSAEEAKELKEELGELSRWTDNQSDDEIVNRALQKAYRTVKDRIEKAVPDVKALNDRWGNLITAEKSTVYRDKIASRQNLISIPEGGAAAAVALTTAIATGGAVIPIIVGLGAAGLAKAGKTPAFKTHLASWLANATPDTLKSAYKEAPWLRSTLQSILLDVDEAEDLKSNNNDDNRNDSNNGD